MDWGWLYGTLLRNAGWSKKKARKQDAVDVFEFIEHLGEHPPAYVILALVHPLEKKAKGEMKEEQVSGMASLLGPPEPLSEEARASLAWLESFNLKVGSEQ